jgi:hypothetical protein
MSNTVKFQTNVPVELRMRSLTGKPVDSQFGGIQHQFLSEQGAFYVSPVVGGILVEQFRKLNIAAGEPIEIMKAEVVANGGKRIQWQVAKIGFAVGEQGDGTFVVATPEPPTELEQRLKASIELVEQRKQAQRAPAAAAAPEPEWARHLVAQSCALVDSYAAVLRHAARHDNVRGDDVRSIFLSAFINVSKGAQRNVA